MQIRLHEDDIFGGFEACTCKRGHSIETKTVRVYSGAGEELVPLVRTLLPEGGHILYLCDRHAEASEKYKSLLLRQFRLTEWTPDKPGDVSAAGSCPLPEDARLLVAVGGGTVADLAKYMAARLKLPLVAVGTSQASAGYLAPSAMLTSDGLLEVFKVRPPEVFILDTDDLPDGGGFDAAGFGEVCSRLTALFDWELSHILSGEPYCKTMEKKLIFLVCDTIKAVEAASEEQRSARIAAACVKLSALLQLTGDSRLMCGGDMQIMHALKLLCNRERREFKLWGENEMLIAQVALRSYSAALCVEESGFLPPPDNNRRMDAMGEYFGLSLKRAMEKVRPYISEEELVRQNFIVNEYRAEFKFKLSIYSKILLHANRVFKRLYKDRGYSYNEYVDASDLSLCIGLAPDLREKFTMLTYMKSLGLLERYIA